MLEQIINIIPANKVEEKNEKKEVRVVIYVEFPRVKKSKFAHSIIK